jgi:glutamyl-tRNA synthetase
MLATAEETGRGADLVGLSSNKATVLAALPELQPRAKTVLELIDLAQFIYLRRPLPLEPTAREQLTPDARAMLGSVAALLEQLSDWTVGSIDGAIRAFAEAQGLKLGKVAQPMRAALTGRTISPGVFEVMVLIGKAESLARITDQSAGAR